VQTLAATVGLVTCVVWVVLETLRSRRFRAEAIVTDRGSFAVLLASYIAGISLAVVSAIALPWAALSLAWVASVVGLLVLWAGIALRWWAMSSLGRYFTFTVQSSADQPVITDGPYRFVRHPGYTGVLLAMVGLGLLLANWLSVLALAVVVAAGMTYRIAVEERTLIATLGQPYEDYRSTRRRLVPYLW
jgi:protein-S-isoprenylcysteine O-methyltransferase Ste14